MAAAIAHYTLRHCRYSLCSLGLSANQQAVHLAFGALLLFGLIHV